MSLRLNLASPRTEEEEEEEWDESEIWGGAKKLIVIVVVTAESRKNLLRECERNRDHQKQYCRATLAAAETIASSISENSSSSYSMTTKNSSSSRATWCKAFISFILHLTLTNRESLAAFETGSANSSSNTGSLE